MSPEDVEGTVKDSYTLRTPSEALVNSTRKQFTLAKTFTIRKGLGKD